MINGTFSGLEHRYSYSAIPVEGWFGFRGVAKLDLLTGDEECFSLPDGVYASETTMAPREGSTAEDDGYLITITMDTNTDESHCVLLDAAAPGDGPIARIRLPERISSGTHACWAPPGV